MLWKSGQFEPDGKAAAVPNRVPNRVTEVTSSERLAGTSRGGCRSSARSYGEPPNCRSRYSGQMRVRAAALAGVLAVASIVHPRAEPPGGPAIVTILHFNDVYEITPVQAGHVGGLAR